MKTPIPILALVPWVVSTLVAQAPAFGQLGQIEPGLSLPVGLLTADIAGRPLSQYPHFEFTRTFHEGTTVWASVDLSRTRVKPGSYPVFVTAHRTPAEWRADAELIDVRGESSAIALAPTSVADNVTTLDLGTLSGEAGLGMGVGYDVVVDVDGDGRLSSGDVIDGFSDEAGFFVVGDPLQDGPLAVTEANYFVSNVKPGFEGENTFYPTGIASMGELPLVVVSHGNGHNYNWYDHIGRHLASWGFVVMSHENDTVTGIDTASLTTLDHTDEFLGSLATIQGGVLFGHIDKSRMMWIGHSRGAEGITRAYDRLVDGTYVPQNFAISDIKGLSSIAPTTFLDVNNSNPYGVPYHLWTAAADADVNGCAGSTVTFTFQLHERATGDRFSVYLHGAGHGVFHNGGGSPVASGPCQVSRARTHEYMREYLLPLAFHFVDGNLAAQDFLWRQHEAFEAPNATPDACVVPSYTYQRRTKARFVVDDFESEPSTMVSSSGGTVTGNADQVVEGPMDDPDTNFTYASTEPMNGMTYHGDGGVSTGAVFGWRQVGKFLEWEVVPDQRNVAGWKWLSFRACQVTRNPNTIGQLGDLTFTVELRDEDGNTSAINIGAYGGGIEESYQRTGCGSGAGWSNFFETIRIRVTDFAADGSPLDLTRVEAIRLKLGSLAGSAVGRIGFDDLEFVHE